MPIQPIKPIAIGALLLCSLAAQAVLAQDDAGARAAAALAGRPATSFSLVDATGKRIGVAYPLPQITVPGGAMAILEIDQVFVPVSLEAYQDGGRIDAERLRFGRTTLAWYASADCTGTPYIRHTSLPTGTRPAVTTSDGANVMLFIGTAGLSSTFTVLSQFQDRTCITANPGYPIEVWPVEKTVNLTTRFREPLRIMPNR